MPGAGQGTPSGWRGSGGRSAGTGRDDARPVTGPNGDEVTPPGNLSCSRPRPRSVTVARQRTTFGKIMREREKQQRAQAKLEKRAERSSEDGEEVEEVAPAHDQDDVLASL